MQLFLALKWVCSVKKEINLDSFVNEYEKYSEVMLLQRLII